MIAFLSVVAGMAIGVLGTLGISAYLVLRELDRCWQP